MPGLTLHRVVEHFVSKSCEGEPCGMCYRQNLYVRATHKVGEEIPHDAPTLSDVGMAVFGHNLTQYLCCFHFAMVLGPGAISFRGCPEQHPAQSLTSIPKGQFE